MVQDCVCARVCVCGFSGVREASFEKLTQCNAKISTRVVLLIITLSIMGQNTTCKSEYGGQRSRTPELLYECLSTGIVVWQGAARSHLLLLLIIMLAVDGSSRCRKRLVRATWTHRINLITSGSGGHFSFLKFSLLPRMTSWSPSDITQADKMRKCARFTSVFISHPVARRQALAQRRDCVANCWQWFGHYAQRDGGKNWAAARCFFFSIETSDCHGRNGCCQASLMNQLINELAEQRLN